jgi:PIN domain nuclease of toxin-antitoxin system
MKLLVDTHAALWFAAGDRRLGRRARSVLEDSANQVLISVASLWEIAIKEARGSLRTRRPKGITLADLPAEWGFVELPIRGSHAAALLELPDIHADPFDRMLVAQAQVEGLTLMTADETVASYPVATIPADE